MTGSTARDERARAVLLGLALGDALGAPFEGRSRVTRVQVEAWRDAHEPLRWTDDTHMARTLARHLVDDPELAAPHALGAAFASAYADEPWRGYGSGPPQVFALVERGMGFEEAASSLFGGSGSFGNGAAMRVAPVGLLPGARDGATASRLATVQARITHTHVDAVDGAIVIAQVVASLLNEDVEPELLQQVVHAAGERIRPGLVLDRVRDVLDALALDGDPWLAAARCGTGVAAAESVPAAIVALLSGRDLLEVVTIAIQLGGDTDTIAAMAGAMAGAAWGLDAVPAGLLARLEARDELADLAVQLSSPGRSSSTRSRP